MRVVYGVNGVGITRWVGGRLDHMMPPRVTGGKCGEVYNFQHTLCWPPHLGTGPNWFHRHIRVVVYLSPSPEESGEEPAGCGVILAPRVPA